MRKSLTTHNRSQLTQKRKAMSIANKQLPLVNLSKAIKLTIKQNNTIQKLKKTFQSKNIFSLFLICLQERRKGEFQN
jgi:hypothetical protein